MFLFSEFISREGYFTRLILSPCFNVNSPAVKFKLPIQSGHLGKPQFGKEAIS